MDDAARGRGATPAPLALLPALALIALTPVGASAAAVGEQGVMVTSITLAADFAQSHLAWAAASRLGCSTDCGLLLRTADGGASWTQVAARGWNNQPVFSSAAAGAVSAGAQHVVTSADGGASFVDTATATGTLDAVPSGRGLTAVVSGESGRFLLALPGHDMRTLPAASLDHATTYLDPAWPRLAAGGAAAFVSGVDHDTGLPVVQRCDATFACSGAAVVGAAKDVARLFVSPHVDADGVILAATSKGFFRSGDGGRSFSAVSVAPPAADTLITTVQGLSFSPDFDASRHTGRVLVAVISAIGRKGEAGKTSGGVYTSGDGATWSHFGAPSALDSGAAAVAAAPDGRVLAAWIGTGTGKVDGGLLCTLDGRAWAPTCPGGDAAHGAGQPATHGAGAAPAAAQSAPPAGAPASTADPAAARMQSDVQRMRTAAAVHGAPSRASTLVIAAAISAGVLGLLAVARRLRDRANRRGSPT